MGCDIHSFAERKRNGKWEKVEEGFIEISNEKEKGNEPFDWRSYSIFAFLAGVRNYDCCEPISEPKGLPYDSEYLNEIYDEDAFYGVATTNKQDIEEGYHSCSYLTLKELLDFDYEKTFWNRRISRTTYRADGSVSGSNGACLAEEGEGEIVTYRENLGNNFFKELEELKTLGEPENVRIVFYFDS